MKTGPKITHNLAATRSHVSARLFTVHSSLQLSHAIEKLQFFSRDNEQNNVSYQKGVLFYQ